MDGDRDASGGTTQVKIADSLGDQVTDSDWLSGQVLESDTYDKAGGTIVGYTVSTSSGPITTATEAVGSGLPNLVARYPSAKAVQTIKGLKKDGTWRTAKVTTTTDPDHGNRVVTSDSTADGQPERCTRTSYAAGSNPQMTGLSDDVLTISGSNACTATATSTNTMSDERTFYDGKAFGSASDQGEATSTQSIDHYDSSGNPVFTTTASSGYDTYGRVTSVTDPNATDTNHPDGATTTTTFTAAHTGELPSTVSTTQAAPNSTTGWTTTTTLDHARGLALNSTDVNGKITTDAYDALGRLTKVWGPGRTTSQNPSTTYTYAVNGTAGPSSTTTATLTSDAPHYNLSVQYLDGFGRSRQTQTTPGISAYHGQVVTDTLYDSHGRQSETRSAYYDDTHAPGNGLFLTTDNEVPGETSTLYDGRDRPTATIFSAYAVEQWRTTTSYPGVDETDTTPPAGGTPTTDIVDTAGQVIQAWQYKTSTATGNASDADVTTYTYSPSGNELTQTDSTTKDKWSYGYDLHGRQISASDPDTGASTSSYDADGRLATLTDARNVTISYDYDLLGRKTAEYSTTAPSTSKIKQAAWTYDSLPGALDEPVSSTRYPDGDTSKPYTTAVTGYDTGYRPTGTTVTLPASEGKLAGPFNTLRSYNPITGVLTATHTDARGDLPAETLNYSYDVNGPLIGFGSGSATYDLSTDYDAFGHPIRTTVNPWGTQIVATDNYDQSTGNLLSSYLDKQTAANGTVQQLTYTYDPAGKITSIRNIADNTPTQTDLQCFSYDYLSRLTTAWTDTGGTTTSAQPSVPNIGQCTNSSPTNGAPTGKTTVGGPAPYWTSYSYDATGNRTGNVQHDPGGDTTKNVSTTQTFAPVGQDNTPTAASNAGGGTGGPHALLSTSSTGPGNPGATSYQYDAIGDTTAITGVSGTTAFTWTPEDQLASATPTQSAGTTTYVYDADGNQLLRRDPGKTTLTIGGDELVLNTSSNTVTDTRIYTLPNGLTAVRQADGIVWQVADNNGTATLALDATTLTEARRPVDPFGAPRGTQPTTWAGDHGFVGGTQDDATGLTNLGAREYQPDTGRFLNPDAELDASAPQQWNGYSYGVNDPLNSPDPSGDCPADLCGIGTFKGGGGGIVTDGPIDPSNPAGGSCHKGSCLDQSSTSKGTHEIFPGVSVPNNWSGEDQFINRFYGYYNRTDDAQHRPDDGGYLMQRGDPEAVWQLRQWVEAVCPEPGCHSPCGALLRLGQEPHPRLRGLRDRAGRGVRRRPRQCVLDLSHGPTSPSRPAWPPTPGRRRRASPRGFRNIRVEDVPSSGCTETLPPRPRTPPRIE
jgi:RHS repeat-associated protein